MNDDASSGSFPTTSGIVSTTAVPLVPTKPFVDDTNKEPELIVPLKPIKVSTERAVVTDNDSRSSIVEKSKKPASDLPFLDEFLEHHMNDAEMRTGMVPESIAVSTETAPPLSSFEDTHDPTLNEQIIAAQEDIKKIAVKQKALEQHTTMLMRDRAQIEKELDPVKFRQEQMHKALALLEREENTTPDIMQRRKLEQERWGLVQDEYRIKQQMLTIQEKLEITLSSIKADEFTYQELLKEQQLLLKRIEMLEAEGKRKMLMKELEESQRERLSIESQAKMLAEERAKVHAMLKQVSAREDELESASHSLIEQQAHAKDAATVRKMVEERYKLEQERHSVEESRWKTEDDLSDLEGKLEVIKTELKKAFEKQEEITAKIKALEVLA